MTKPTVMHTARQATDTVPAPLVRLVPLLALVVMVNGQMLSPAVGPAISDSTFTALSVIQSPVVFSGKAVLSYAAVVRRCLPFTFSGYLAQIAKTLPGFDAARR